MSILLIHRFYAPDSPPYASILKDIRELAISNKYRVDVLSSQPSYKTVDQFKKFQWKIQDDDGCIYRLPVFLFLNQKIAKTLNFFWFPFVVFIFILFGKKYQAITVSTAPPVLLGFFTALACRIRGTSLIYHCMDIHPEIGKISGEFKSQWIFKLLKIFDLFTCQYAKKIIVLSEDMRQSLLNRDKKLTDKINIINNYNLGESEIVKQNFFNPKDGVIRLIFAGNLGRFQNLTSLIKALEKSNTNKDLEIIFMGEGDALNDLRCLTRELALELKVRFIPHQPVEVAKQVIKDSHMAIVSLQKEVIKYAYPSKTMTYLSLGTPILALVEEESELSKMIVSNHLGIVSETGDVTKIAEHFDALSHNVYNFDRSKIKKFFLKNFSKKEFEGKFLHLLSDII